MVGLKTSKWQESVNHHLDPLNALQSILMCKVKLEMQSILAGTDGLQCKYLII